jgi:hypothetical protein
MKKTKWLLALLAAPTAALAFESVDTIRWPREFPAYEDAGTRTGPTEVFAHVGMMRDDNILRAETGGVGDTVTRIGAGIRHTQRVIGRQSVRLEGRADSYIYDRFGDIDHIAYGLLGEWLWEVGNQLSGTVGATRSRRNIDISEAQRAVRDMVTESRYYATAGYMVTPSFRVRGGLEHARGERASRSDAELQRNGFVVGAEYVSTLGNILGVEARRSEGDAPVPEFVAPVGTFVNNDSRESEVALVGTYNVGTTLRTSARIGRTKRDYSQIPGRDFDGTTGRATVDWLPGNKTLLSFSAYKEPRSILDVAASHVLIKGVTFGASWATTAKLVLSARWLREQRDFEGDPALSLVPGTPLRSEVVRLWRFAVGWEPARHWEVGFGLDKGDRESNFAGRDYDFTAVVGNVTYRF